MEDLNASTGNTITPGITEKYNAEIRNANGEKVIILLHSIQAENK